MFPGPQQKHLFLTAQWIGISFVLRHLVEEFRFPFSMNHGNKHTLRSREKWKEILEPSNLRACALQVGAFFITCGADSHLRGDGGTREYPFLANGTCLAQGVVTSRFEG